MSVLSCDAPPQRTLVGASEHVEQTAVAQIVAESSREVAALHVDQPALVEAAAREEAALGVGAERLGEGARAAREGGEARREWGVVEGRLPVEGGDGAVERLRARPRGRTSYMG